MKAPATISLFRRQFADLPLAEKTALLALHAALELLADGVAFARLDNGNLLRDAIDFESWLRELHAEVARSITKPVENVKVCPRCGHVHQDRECGKDMGGAGVCKCDVEVRA